MDLIFSTARFLTALTMKTKQTSVLLGKYCLILLGALVTAPFTRAQAPAVTLSPSSYSANYGQVITFTVAASCGSGLGQMGFESCTSSGTGQTNLGYQAGSGTSDSKIFYWTAPASSGTYYFDGYSWDTSVTNLTRTTPVAITVSTTHPVASISASTSVVATGGNVDFTVGGTADNGVIEIGLESSDSSGNITGNLGIDGGLSGSPQSHVFPWTAPGTAGVYYFGGYAWNGSNTELNRTTPALAVTVGVAPAVSVSATNITFLNTIQDGHAVGFTVTGAGVTGVSEVGLESTDSSANVTGNLGYQDGFSGSPHTKSVSWTGGSTGTYYFGGYARDSTALFLTRTGYPPFIVTVTTYGTPTYDGPYWNTNSSIKNDNNCYNYANNNRTDTFAQPGHAHSYNLAANGITLAHVQYAVGLDGLASTTSSAVSSTGQTKLALVLDLVSTQHDYHWYRQNADGTWSHKPGHLDARNTDYSNNTITDPENCDAGTYTTWGGYWFTPSDMNEGSGHASIN